MGTFHQNKGELHGITVIVDTTRPVEIGDVVTAVRRETGTRPRRHRK